MENKGTFLNCTNCQKCINCCQSFDKLNAPLLTKKEVDVIGTRYANFFDKTETSLYALKVIDNTCIFYKENQCMIYDIRPLDCRLYPFDIIKEDNKYYLIMYKLDCIEENFIKESEDIDAIIREIKPFIDDYTNPQYYTKMKDIDYIVIREIT